MVVLKDTLRHLLNYLTALVFDYGGGIFHGVHLTDKDIEILKDKNVLTVTNPAANCKLSSGVADVCKLLENNVPVALGTDGPGGNNALDMFREMYLVTALQKIKTGNPQALPPTDVLKWLVVPYQKHYT